MLARAVCVRMKQREIGDGHRSALFVFHMNAVFKVAFGQSIAKENHPSLSKIHFLNVILPSPFYNLKTNLIFNYFFYLMQYSPTHPLFY